MRQNKEGYYVNRHSCFLLQYQLVLVTKYRKPVITGQLEERLKEYTKAYFEFSLMHRRRSILQIILMHSNLHHPE